MRAAALAGFAVLLALCAAAEARGPRLDPRLHRKLRRQGKANIFVTMQENLGDAMSKEAYFDTRGAKIKELVVRMQAAANQSQSALEAVVQSATVGGLASEVRHFWISNEIFFADADYELVEQMMKLENAGIADIREEAVGSLAAVNKSSDLGAMGAPSWGVQRIQAPSVWASGNLGQGVVIGVMDSGVLHTHEALRDNFRSDYGWFDPEKKSPTPYVSDYHGTHVTAIAVGGKGVGVAPGAQWIHCKACRGRDCPEADVKSCTQFMMCPTDTNGNNKDCSKAPRIINISIGYPSDIFKDIVSTWAKAGIIPVASIGNSGPNCSTTLYPGGMENVIGVGAVSSSDTLSYSSSRGPNGIKLKPDVVAPGEKIRSAMPGSISAYALLDGTSMAAPHVAGTVALMLSVTPSLNVTQVLEKFKSTADTFMMKEPYIFSSPTCDYWSSPANTLTGDIGWGKWPNYLYGYGLVNALSAQRGACFGLDTATCESTFFCTWNSNASRCQRWW